MKRKTSFIVFFVCILLVFSMFTVYFKSQKLIESEKKEAIQIASEKVSLSKVMTYYPFHTDKVYYSFSALDDQKNQIYVIVDPETKQVDVYQANQIVTEEEAKSITVANKNPEKVIQARLGKVDDIPVWEVQYRLSGRSIGYYYIAVTTGEWVKDIENI